MKRYMHIKTLGLILATTTTLQLTGAVSQLLNGIPFVKAEAATVIMGNSTSSVQVYANGVTTPAQVTLQTPLPSNKTIAELNSSYNMLTFKLDLTTSLGTVSATTAASVNWIVNGLNTAVCSGTVIQIGEYQLIDTIKYSYSVPIQAPSTTLEAAYVRISGTERVGKNLDAELRNYNGTRFTTSAGVVYRWYRLDNKNDNISDGTLVEDDDSYDLVSADRDHYIKVLVTYNGVTYTDITGDIDRRSSSSSSDDDDEDTIDEEKDYIKEPRIEKDSYGNIRIIENGRYASGWRFINSKWYLADSAGNVQIGWRKVNGFWYFLKDDGAMVTGWQKWNGKWYLLGGDGKMLTNWQIQGGSWYLLNNDGSMMTGWQLVNNKWYYLYPSGAMATGWQKWNGRWYYLYSDGSMAKSTVIDGYRVGATGAWIQ